MKTLKDLFKIAVYCKPIAGFRLYREIRKDHKKNPDLKFSSEWASDFDKRHKKPATLFSESAYEDCIVIRLISYDTVEIKVYDGDDGCRTSLYCTLTAQVSSEISGPIIMLAIDRKAIQMHEDEIQEKNEKRIKEITDKILG